MTKFNERLSLRLIELEEIKESNMLPSVPDEATSKAQLEFKIECADKFWTNQVKDVIVERVIDDDSELIELQKAWLKMTNLFTSPTKTKKSSVSKKSVKQRPRRIARGGATVPAQSNRLQPIAEDSNSEMSRAPVSSSSEVPALKRVRICDVIEEERKSSDISEDEEQNDISLSSDKLATKIARNITRGFSQKTKTDGLPKLKSLFDEQQIYKIT
jgi:hypothetical protein